MPRLNTGKSRPQNMRLSLFAEELYDRVADSLGLNRRGAIEVVARHLHRIEQSTGKPFSEILVTDKNLARTAG